MRLTLLSLLLTIVLVVTVRAQEAAHAPPETTKATADSIPASDTDLDGALIGAAIVGCGAFLVGAFLQGGFECREECVPGILAIAGAIAGFWGGLAQDLQNCEDPRARGRSRAPKRQRGPDQTRNR